MQCQLDFSKCNTSIRIKRVLNRLSQILSDKTQKSAKDLEEESDELIRNVLANGQYTNGRLMNDFYHIKYNHNTNDDPKQFATFYDYLCDNDRVLQCDIAHCQSAQRYFNPQHETEASLSEMSETFDYLPIKDVEQKEETDLYTFHFLCRIHTYFIHSHDLPQLTDDERRYIENYIKYMDRTFEGIDCDKIASVLRSNKINIDANVLQMTFDEHHYDMKQLMTDLCDILTNKASNDTLLSSIIMDALQSVNDTEKIHKRQRICDAILRCGFITKQDLNHDNFVKILEISAHIVNPLLKAHEIDCIACDKQLTGNIYIKGTDEFMNSINFGGLFKTIANWNTSEWTNIYLNIEEWTSSKTAINIQEFCAYTGASEDVALLFLQKTQWNMHVAVNRYFSFNGDFDALDRGNDTDHYAYTNYQDAANKDDKTSMYIMFAVFAFFFFSFLIMNHYDV